MKPKKSISWAVILIVAILVLPALGASAKEKGSSAIPKAEALSKLSKLHIPFILNQGQVDERVKYYARTFGGTVFVTEAGEILYSLPKRDGEEKTLSGWVLKEELLQGSTKGVKAEEEALTKVSYFIGDDASRWRSNISTYGCVSFGEVYEGIEVKVKAYGKSVEKLFYVRAGAKPGLIRLRLNGAESLGVNGEGELEVRTGLGEVKFSKPVAYQEVEGKRRYVEVSYQVEGNDYGFKLGAYDRERELVIDPILQSTYLGGSSSDWVWPIAINSQGDIYAAGSTTSTNFPGTGGGAQRMNKGDYDAFVAQLDPNLTTLVQCTYLGGGGTDYAYSIAIDSGGNVYVAGFTTSPDFPGTAEGTQTSFGGGYSDAFVAKLDETLTTLIQSTYLGGSGDDRANSITIGNGVYVGGYTTSTNFPGTVGGAQDSYGGGNYDAFVTKLDLTLKMPALSTYLGGSDWDDAISIALDSAGNVYVTGRTKSTDFPGTEGGAQTSNGGDDDAFVARLNAILTEILKSTYLGGSGTEYAYSIAIDSEGNVYVVGNTTSDTDFPGTAGGAQDSFGGGVSDAFIAKLNAALTSIVQSTYLGGNGDDSADSIAISSSGNIYVAGFTASSDFPGRAGGPQPSKGGGWDAFVAWLNLALTDLTQSTYLGGSDDEYAYSIAIGLDGTIYVAGHTHSTDFPGTLRGAQSSNGGDDGGFVTRLAFTVEAVSTPSIPDGPMNAETGTSYAYTVRGSTSNIGDSVQYLFDWGDGTNSNWLPAGTMIAHHSWASARTSYSVMTQARCATHTSVVSSWSRTLSVTVETVSNPTTPTGLNSGSVGVSYVYSTSGSSSESGHSIQYLFDWGDGTNSGWLPVGKTSASKSWALPGTYSVKAKARCSTHNLIISSWSTALDVSMQKVTVLQPNGGEVIPSGKPYTIQWTAPAQAEKFKLLYSTNNGATWILITSVATGTRYDWTVPKPVSNQNSCYVKVVAYSASNVKVGEDKSDKPFAIGVVKLFSPNGGEVLESGVIHQIQWEINGTKYPVATVKLYYTINSGTTWSLITTLDGSFRSYDWIPLVQITKTKCKVKVAITDTKGVTTPDMSDGYFTIQP